MKEEVKTIFVDIFNGVEIQVRNQLESKDCNDVVLAYNSMKFELILTDEKFRILEQNLMMYYFVYWKCLFL